MKNFRKCLKIFTNISRDLKDEIKKLKDSDLKTNYLTQLETFDSVLKVVIKIIYIN